MNKNYVRCKVNGKWTNEHRALMEQLLNRKLGRYEFIHHINGNRRDNRIENLEVVTPAVHAMRHNLLKHPKIKTCEVCGRSYEPLATHRKTSKTCSKQCAYYWLSLKFRNPNAPHSFYAEDAQPNRAAFRKIRPVAQAAVSERKEGS